MERRQIDDDIHKYIQLHFFLKETEKDEEVAERGSRNDCDSGMK